MLRELLGLLSGVLRRPAPVPPRREEDGWGDHDVRLTSSSGGSLWPARAAASCEGCCCSAEAHGEGDLAGEALRRFRREVPESCSEAADLRRVREVMES